MDISLNGHEARTLGVLVEKAFTTPDQYPLSLNALTNGCNQKSNRAPVTDYSEAEVTVALTGLRHKHLAGASLGAGSRVERWRHNALEGLKVGERALAVLAELLLRGPQAPGELRTRCNRMRSVPSQEDLAQVLAELEGLGMVERIRGGRADRWGQTLCPESGPAAGQLRARRPPCRAWTPRRRVGKAARGAKVPLRRVWTWARQRICWRGQA